MRLPMLNDLGRQQQMVQNLRGLNLTGTVQDGEWSWTQNTDTRLAPMTRRREKRIKVGQLTKPNGLTALDKLCFVDGTKFYYNGYRYYEGTDTDPVTDSEKQLIPMGSDIIILPDAKIFNTLTHQFRPMNVSNTTNGTVTVTLARPDGTPYDDYTVSDTPPADPENGDLWLDTSETTAVMKSWSAYTGMWVDEYTTCISVEADGIGAGLAIDDAVEVSGLEDDTLNGTWQLLYVEDDMIVYTGVITAQQTQSTPVTAKREAPAMDFVIEHNNRLWGCSSEAHEIYCCALGDPTNWRRYLGISTDSWAVTVGSPGPFTGAAVVNSSVCFFKENCIHKVFGTMPSNFQTTVDHYRGVQAGSGKSLVRVNELVYFKSVFDFCAYDGAEVQGCSTALGLGPWTDAVSGTNDRRVYVSMKDGENNWHLLTYDTETGYWMREDNVHALFFTQVLTETFMLTEDGGLWALREGEYARSAWMVGPDFVVTATPETDQEVPWTLRTGWIGIRLGNNKHIGKIQLMVEMDTGAAMTVRVRKDNEDWSSGTTYAGAAGRRYTLPIWPRRCDRLMIEMSGTGGAKIINMNWLIEYGSEYGRE